MIIDQPNAGDIPGLRRLWRQAFGDSEEFLDLFFSAAFAPERCRMIREGGDAAAALYWFDCGRAGKKVAYIYAVATAESHRGRGLCRALMEHLHESLTHQGYAGAILVPGEPELFRFYERLGYATCASVGELACAAGETATALEPVDPGAYAALRRQLLPPEGLIQEGENLRFLEVLGDFYAGPKLVLWVTRDEQDSVIGELLGDVSQAPGVVKALGAARGVFRIPGGTRAFAMYRSFDGGKGPAYLGFAFD